MRFMSGFGCPVLNGDQVFIPATDKQLRLLTSTSFSNLC